MTPPNRLRLRFRLRTFLVLVAVACVSLGWYASLAIRQQRAIQGIRALGGHARYEDARKFEGSFKTVTYGTMMNVTEVPAPQRSWLRKMLGEDWFTNVAIVSVKGKEFSNDDMPALRDHLESLPRLERLELLETSVTGRGLKPLATLEQLDYLCLRDTKIRIDNPDLIELRRSLPLLRVGY